MSDAYARLFPLVFVGAALGVLLLEQASALRRQPVRIAGRWTSNLALLVIGSVLTGILLPAGVYAFAATRPPGLLSGSSLPFVLQIALALLVLDFCKYWEHRAFHAVPLFWRAHLVHHSDTDIDVTTTERHHPLEVAASTGTLIALIAALGLPATAVGIYLLTAAVASLAAHANLRLPAPIDRGLRALVVTPPVHAVHHSDARRETDSNFGTVLTIWDRLFGSYANPERARIPHFGLGYFHRAADARLGRVLLQPFLFRREFADLVRSDARETPPMVPAARALSPQAARALLAGALACALVVVAMGSTVADMAATWANTEAYQFGWLVVPMAVYVIGWYDRAPLALRPDLSGLPVGVVAATCWGAATLMNLDVGRQFALVLAVQGIAMSTFGWRAYRQRLPAFALLFLMIPAGDLLQPVLRVLTLKSIELFAILSQVPHRIDGFVVYIGANRYIVADECSGLAYVNLAAFLGYCFGLLLYRSFPRVIGMALAGAAAGFASNVLRVNAIVLTDWWRGSQMDLAAHGAFQWIGLLAALGVLFVLLRRLQGDRDDGDLDAGPLPPPRPAWRFAPVLAALPALVVAGAAGALQADDSIRSQSLPAASLPQIVSGWTRVELAPSRVEDVSGRVATLRATYTRDGRELRIVVVEALGPTVKLPASPPSSDEQVPPWREKATRAAVGCAHAGCVTFTHATWERDRGQRVREVYFAYTVGRLVTDSRLALRVAQGWDRLAGHGEHPRLIGLVSEGASLDVDEVAAWFFAVDGTLAAPRALLMRDPRPID